MKKKKKSLRDIMVSIVDVVLTASMLLEFAFFCSVVEESLTVSQLALAMVASLVTVAFARLLGTFRRLDKLFKEKCPD